MDQSVESRDKMVEEIRRLDSEFSGELTRSRFDRNSELSSNQVIGRLGLWSTAKKTALNQEKADREDVIDGIRDVADKVEGELTLEKFSNNSDIKEHVIFENFDSWLRRRR